MQDAIRNTAADYGLFAPGQIAVVGVSGGPDSTALLHALAALRDTLGIELVTAHLNHGFRGAEADADADFVQSLSRSLDIACHVEKYDVPARQKRRHSSAQEAAREVRHAFLRRVAEQTGTAARIALGHTQDDRIETVLLNLLRGTGPEGLQGFPPVALPIVRPLYHVSRTAVEAYCAENQLAPRRDSSNAKPDYRRNRVRSELLPHLTAYYNEGIENALLRMSTLISADNAFMESQAHNALARCVREQSRDALLLDAAALNALPLALRRRAVRQAIAQVRGTLHDIGFEPIEAAMRLLQDERDNSFSLPQRDAIAVQVSGSRHQLQIAVHAAPASAMAWQQRIVVPGEMPLLHAGGTLRARIFASGHAAAVFLAAEHESKARQDAFRTARLLCFPLDTLVLPLIVRSWQAGDRMRPYGLNGTKKLQDIFTDAKIPAAQRTQWPVIQEAAQEQEQERGAAQETDNTGDILAVMGLRPGERALHEKQIAAQQGAVCLLEWQA